MAVIVPFLSQVLADSSIWVQHFRYGLPQLDLLLQQNSVCIHLLTSARLTPHTCLWTLDKRLAILAQRLAEAYAMPSAQTSHHERT